MLFFLFFSYAPALNKRKAPEERLPLAKKAKFDSSQRNDSKDVLINNLKLALEEATKKLESQEKTLKLLQKKVSKLSSENLKLKQQNAKLAIDRKLERFLFNDDQILAISRKSMAYTKWSNKTVETAIGFSFTCGTKGYENLLQVKFPYPSIRTLQRRLQNIKFESGILSEILEFLKLKVATFNEHEKECVLLLDEMAITEEIQYDCSINKYVGDVTFPNSQGRANQALVFMIGGISSRWKQVIAYFYTNGKVNGEDLKNVILNIIGNIEIVGLRINSITSDMGSMNQSMWKAFGINCGHFSSNSYFIKHPSDPNRIITFLADVPHLLKNIRTSLFSNKLFLIPETIQKKYNLPNNVINSEHIKS